jgi:hypothetical protein
VGNHAFARDINERVPQLWNVINDQARAAASHQPSRVLCQCSFPDDLHAWHASHIEHCGSRHASHSGTLQDTVPRSGKFFFMYKRPGQRVLINSDGDILVRFSPILHS